VGVAIVGAGGHGRVALECLQLSGELGPDEDIAHFDDQWDSLDSTEGVPIYGPVLILAEDQHFPYVFVGIGDNRARRRISLELERAGKSFLTILHPQTVISPRAKIGEGSIAIAGTVVNRDAQVGRGVILNTTCTVGHDCRVGDFAQISPGVNLGGAAIIGEGAFLGIGVKVVPLARVGAWSIVGAGSVVLNDLPDRHFCVGAPARPIRSLRKDEFPADESSLASVS